MFASFSDRLLHCLTAGALAAVLALGGLHAAPAPGHARAAAPALDLAPFQALAQAASCAESSNRLFVIDDQLVYWDRAGFCADNGYAYTLFGARPDEVLCSVKDSFIGPRRSCQEGYQPLFDTITRRRDDADLGLGTDHDVQEVPVAAGT